LCFHLFISGFTQFTEFFKYSQVIELIFNVLIETYPIFVELDIFQQCLCCQLVIPERRDQRPGFFILDQFYAVIVVKDTSSGQEPSRPAACIVRLSSCRKDRYSLTNEQVSFV